MPFGNPDAYDDEDDNWPHDDLPAEFDVDEEFKDVEGYVAEYGF